MDNALPQGRARHFLADVDLVDLGLDGDVLHVQAHGKRDAGARLYQTHALLLNQDRIRRGLSGTKFAQVYQNSLLNLKGKNEEKKKKKKDSCAGNKLPRNIRQTCTYFIQFQLSSQI